MNELADILRRFYAELEILVANDRLPDYKWQEKRDKVYDKYEKQIKLLLADKLLIGRL